MGNTTVTASSSDDLLNQVNSQETVDKISYEAIGGTKKENTGNALKAVGSGAAAGAAVGSMFGPIGTVIGTAAGALIGGVSAWIGGSKKKREAERKQRELERKRQQALIDRSANNMVAANNVQIDMMENAAYNYAAYGGLFNRFDDGGDLLLNLEEDNYDYTPTKIDSSKAKKRETIIEPFTENYKVLSVEKTPEEWLLKRQSQYNSNLSDYLKRPVTIEESNASLTEAINRMNATPASIMEPFYDDYLDKDSWRSAITTDTETSEAVKASTARAMDKSGAGAKFLELPREAIMYNIPLEYYPEVAPHERTHSLKLEASENAIKDRNIKLKEGIEPDSYLDDPKEIYARLMGLRVTENLDPNKTYDVKEIKEILNKAGDKHDLGNRYSDEDLEFLFNQVAYNNPSNLNIEIPEQMKYNNIEEVNYAADGGPLFNEFSNGVTIINEGGTHEENPHGGIQVGVDPEGIPNLVEEGEVIYNDYVFSNRITVPKHLRGKYKLSNKKNLTFADAAKEIQKQAEEMPNDPIAQNTMDLRLFNLRNDHEIMRQKKHKNNINTNKQANVHGFGERLKKLGNADTLKGIGTGLDYVSNLGASLASNIQNWSGKNEADLTHVNQYRDAINRAYKPIEAQTLNDYLEFNPYDTSYELNKLAGSQAASREALRNTTNNPAALRAAIIASDYNYGNQIGDTYRRAREYNDANRERVAGFNRGTNHFNAQSIAEAARFNAQQANLKAEAEGKAAQWEQSLKEAKRQEHAEQFNNLISNVSNIGKDLYNRGTTKMLRDNGILVGSDGKMYQIPSITSIKRAKGGKLNKKKSNNRRLS
jgi:hypothetical protein